MALAHPGSREFAQSVRDALAHLYDYSYLQNHPLASALVTDVDLDSVTRAQTVRRILLDCIEALKPQEAGPRPFESTRAYAILTYRYLDGLSIDQIATRLALSRRQVYREHRRGIEAIASLLEDRLRTEVRKPLPTLVGVQGVPSDRLEVAREEVDRLRRNMHRESLELRDIVRSVLQTTESMARERDVHIEVVEQAVWPHVLADRVMLRQALLNILGKAIDIVDQGQLTINASKGSREVTLTVSGQLSAANRQPAQSGAFGELNLAVAQALIEAQEGRQVTSRKEDGWQAHIVLPLADKITILVIDDSADLIALLQRYLAGRIASVVGATDGKEALRLAAELKPRLIILDIMMHGLDGWEILHRLRQLEETKQTPIIICSVLHQKDMARAVGAVDYLEKPIRQMDLLRALRRWLGQLPPVAEQ